jgi:hypothetical protein
LLESSLIAVNVAQVLQVLMIVNGHKTSDSFLVRKVLQFAETDLSHFKNIEVTFAQFESQLLLLCQIQQIVN